MLPKFLPKMQAVQIREMPERKNGIVATKLPKLQRRGERKFNKNCGSQVAKIGVEEKKIVAMELPKIERKRREKKKIDFYWKLEERTKHIINFYFPTYNHPKK